MAARTRQLVSGDAGSSRAQQSTVLPEYQPNQFPLTIEAQQLLHNLAVKQKIEQLNQDLQTAILKLSNAASDVNERVSDQRERQKKRARLVNDAGSSSQDANIEEVDNFEKDAEQTVKKMELNVRKMIDSQHSVVWMNESAIAASTHAREHASTQASLPKPPQSQPARGSTEQDDGGSEDGNADEQFSEINPTAPTDNTPQVIGPSIVFKEQFEHRHQKWRDTSLANRYADNKDYRNYREMVHSALHPDVPAPAPNTWFKERPPARPGITEAGDEDGSEEEEDFQMTRAVTSTKCPITLQEFKEPLTSNKCPHTYEASVIRDMIRHSSTTIPMPPEGRATAQAVQCPVQGCSNMLTLDDLHEDQIVLRRIRRLQRAREIEEQEMLDRGDGARDGTQGGALVIDEDGDDDGYDVDEIEDEAEVKPSRRVKRETRSSMR